MKNNINKNNLRKNFMPYALLLFAALFIFFSTDLFNTKTHVFSYSDFENSLKENKITELSIIPDADGLVYQVTGKLDGYSKNEVFYAKIPLSETVINRILESKDIKDFKLNTESDPSSGFFIQFLVNVLPMLLIVGGAIYIFGRQMGNSNKSMDFGKSRAKLSEDGGKVTFKDVAGLTEEKEEVAELIDFLKNPKKFQKLGARIPKGVLLVGPPGTGKTLLAKAVAGEANVPFYFISGSDFVELFVGIGASRVRDMFRQAKQNAPCLVFIDEIDAVGRQRGTGLGGGHDEREQTLNQLLTEMDGFGANEGIIIIAATNRPDVLDPALLRPGRFDRQVTVNLPDVKGREEILAVHARNKVFAPSVKLSNIAKRTVGFSGADLENLLNEAALLAVRRNKEAITMEEIDEASDRVLMGPAKTSRKVTEYEKKIVAYHEAGHAVSGIVLPNGEEVHKITIIPRGMAGGYTQMLPKEERTLVYTKKELEEQIITLLSGRASEQYYLKEISTGASDDLKRATKIARSMVTEYGMSSLGPMQFEHRNESVFLGRDYNQTKNFSDQVALLIDQEVKKIIDDCYEKAQKIVSKEKKLVEILANRLIANETLTKEEIEDLVEANSNYKIKDDEEVKKEKDTEKKEKKDEIEK